MVDIDYISSLWSPRYIFSSSDEINSPSRSTLLDLRPRSLEATGNPRHLLPLAASRTEVDIHCPRDAGTQRKQTEKRRQSSQGVGGGEGGGGGASQGLEAWRQHDKQIDNIDFHCVCRAEDTSSSYILSVIRGAEATASFTQAALASFQTVPCGREGGGPGVVSMGAGEGVEGGGGGGGGRRGGRHARTRASRCVSSTTVIPMEAETACCPVCG